MSRSGLSARGLKSPQVGASYGWVATGGKWNIGALFWDRARPRLHPVATKISWSNTGRRGRLRSQKSTPDTSTVLLKGTEDLKTIGNWKLAIGNATKGLLR